MMFAVCFPLGFVLIQAMLVMVTRPMRRRADAQAR